MISGLDRLANNICDDIENELSRIGVLCRIFGRAKTENSIKLKFSNKDYANSKEGKLMQDLIGVRIVVYFKDDLPLVQKALKSKFTFVDETIDKATETIFEPNRINLIFRMKESYSEEIEQVAVKKYKYIDTTYEVQLRTILSEGWHEIEHDLRYKCKVDWEEYSDLSRTLNGIYASLETSDWSILSLFDQLAYQHYKSNNLTAMIRTKFRIRLSSEVLDKTLEKIILEKGSTLKKDIYKIDRIDLLNRIFDDGIKFPLTFSNLIYILNGYYLQNQEILAITPSYILNKKEIFGEIKTAISVL